MVDCRVWCFESGTITGCFAKLGRAMVWIRDEGCGSVWKCKDGDFANSESFFLGGVAWKVPVFFFAVWWLVDAGNCQCTNIYYPWTCTLLAEPRKISCHRSLFVQACKEACQLNLTYLFELTLKSWKIWDWNLIHIKSLS